MIQKYNADVLIIGAGPAGALAAALLCNKNYSVCILEQAQFPRFCIGESLLPQSMEFLEKAGALPAIQTAAFQYKNGAAFNCGTKHNIINFQDKFTSGWDSTFEVQRATFDDLLAKHAISCGAEIYFQHTVQEYKTTAAGVTLSGVDITGNTYTASGKFVLDASGYGRVLPRLLNLDKPSDFPVRKAIFTHIKDNIINPNFDRNKILITINPDNTDIWYWLIPFSDGTASIGVVGKETDLVEYGNNDQDCLTKLISIDPYYAQIIPNYKYLRAINSAKGYSCSVTSLYGTNYALLGNAGEFLDPIFSSGLTIAFKSADLAVQVLLRQLAGTTTDWEQEYAAPLSSGVQVFKTFVESWYKGDLQNIILKHDANADSDIKRMIASILAGYVWDNNNPFVAQSEKYINILATRYRDE